jgi:Tfp pilus assembly protein PilN
MINLLPPKEKKDLLLREQKNIVFSLEILFLAFLISLSLILLAIKIWFAKDLEIQQLFLEEKKKEVLLQKDFEEKIINLNQTLLNLKSFYQKQISLTQVLEKISHLLPRGIYLTNFNFNLKEKEGQITLTGFCQDRETLLSFKKILEENGSFSEVYFPPENWVKPTDINFVVSFKIK